MAHEKCKSAEGTLKSSAVPASQLSIQLVSGRPYDWLELDVYLGVICVGPKITFLISLSTYPEVDSTSKFCASGV